MLRRFSVLLFRAVMLALSTFMVLSVTILSVFSVFSVFPWLPMLFILSSIFTLLGYMVLSILVYFLL